MTGNNADVPESTAVFLDEQPASSFEQDQSAASPGTIADTAHSVIGLRAYAIVTGSYWTFTVTDGALRMLVLLYFHDLGYNPVALAMLFLLYELFGVFTNLVGGWVGARQGLRSTLIAGLGLQIVALSLLSLHQPSWREWLAVAWVMIAQALAGIAKDLTKMSAKTAVKFFASEGRLFRIVAALTGSKNALKGVGFFIGAALLGWLGFRSALLVMAAAIAVALVVVLVVAGDMGQPKQKPPASAMLKKSPAVRRLSLARFFLFGARDIWFVVALPVFLDESLGWSFEAIGAFLAIWVIGYGIVQSIAPGLLAWLASLRLGAKPFQGTQRTGGEEASPSTYPLLLIPPMAAISVVIALAVRSNEMKALTTVGGLLIFGILFALTSSVHSYLILAYSASPDDTAMDVGYYYSANAGGRLVGTLLSGVLFMIGGLPAALIGTALFLQISFMISWGLPAVPSPPSEAQGQKDKSNQNPTPQNQHVAMS